jgi:ATP adenylyltransferase
MDRMYAPWRLAFIKGQEAPDVPSPSGCIFCDFPLTLGDAPPVRVGDAHNAETERADWDRTRLVVSAREHAFVILNKYPYTNGHVMVVPRRHTERIEDLSREEFVALHELLHETTAALREAYEPHGMNVGMNMGRAGGAGIDEHIHYHALPRWSGDVNFMPVFSDTRVISEGLDDTYARLCALLRKPQDDLVGSADAVAGG